MTAVQRAFSVTPPGGKPFQVVAIAGWPLLSNRDGRWAVDKQLTLADLIMPEHTLAEWDIEDVAVDRVPTIPQIMVDDPQIQQIQKLEDRILKLQDKTDSFATDLEKYNPDEPRDEAGKWTDGGGGSGSPTVTGLGSVAAKVRAGVASLPASHLARVSDIPIRVEPRGAEGWAGFFRSGGGSPPHIAIAGNQSYLDHATQQRREVSLKDPAKVVIHEIGHALDFKTHGDLNRRLAGTVMADAKAMTPGEQAGARHWLSNSTEMFAETYALAFGPKNGRYFGYMTSTRARKVFANSVSKLKEIVS